MGLTPPTQYAQSGDVHVAYQVTGRGEIDMVLAPGTVSHLDLDWDRPEKVSFIERLSSFCRLIRFDKRGTGLCDRPLNVATLEDRIDDIRAVMDAAGSERAVLFGVSEGGLHGTAVRCDLPAADALVACLGCHGALRGVMARWFQADDYPWGITREESDRLVAD
jgi:pimeloyl-ACP methyl ester carboxylesterase